MSAFVDDAVRTPFGKFSGGLSGARPDDLAATVLGAIRDRHPELDPAAVEEVVNANANGNASPLHDGASAVLLGSGRATLLGDPPARIGVCIGVGQGLAVVLEHVA